MKKIKLSQNGHRSLWLTLVIIAFLVGALAGWQFSKQKYNTEANIKKIHPLNSSYKFINPLLAIDVTDNGKSVYEPLKLEVSNLINQKVKNGKADNVSFYFQELETGQRVGINTEKSFDPASLSKVPVMIAYLKLAESEPNLLNTKIFFEPALFKKINEDPKNSKYPSDIDPDRAYTVEELIYRMIVNSDNTAAELLLYLNDGKNLIINKSFFRSVLAELSIPTQSDEFSNYQISAKQYSLFFRILYNSTFLDQEMSEKALQLLSQSTFKEGLAAGIPPSIPVAHKFGEYSTGEGGTLTDELHDCGIIYYPKNPYLLCVMTRGEDPNDLKETIKDISSLVYNRVNSKSY